MKKEINKSNKIVRVLAVDDNESLIGMLEEYFKDHEKIKIVNHQINYFIFCFKIELLEIYKKL